MQFAPSDQAIGWPRPSDRARDTATMNSFTPRCKDLVPPPKFPCPTEGNIGISHSLPPRGFYRFVALSPIGGTTRFLAPRLVVEREFLLQVNEKYLSQAANARPMLISNICRHWFSSCLQSGKNLSSLRLSYTKDQMHIQAIVRLHQYIKELVSSQPLI